MACINAHQRCREAHGVPEEPKGAPSVAHKTEGFSAKSGEPPKAFRRKLRWQRPARVIFSSAKQRRMLAAFNISHFCLITFRTYPRVPLLRGKEPPARMAFAILLIWDALSRNRWFSYNWGELFETAKYWVLALLFLFNSILESMKRLALRLGLVSRFWSQWTNLVSSSHNLRIFFAGNYTKRKG